MVSLLPRITQQQRGTQSALTLPQLPQTSCRCCHLRPWNLLTPQDGPLNTALSTTKVWTSLRTPIDWMNLRETIRFNLGRVSHNQGNFDDALCLYKRALEALERWKQFCSAVRCWCCCGHLYINNGHCCSNRSPFFACKLCKWYNNQPCGSDELF